MNRALHFTVVGRAIPKGSTKAFVMKHTRADGSAGHRAVVTGDNRSIKDWQTLVANCVSLELQRAENRGFFLHGGVEFIAWFYLPRPKDLCRPSKSGAQPHTKKPDADKLARAAKDALTGLVWRDDAQVTDLIVHKRYAAVGEPPRAVFTIRAAAIGAGALLEDHAL